MKSLNVYGQTSPYGARSSGRKGSTMDPHAYVAYEHSELGTNDVFGIPKRKKYCPTCGQVIELDLWFDHRGNPISGLRRHDRWIDGFRTDCIGAGFERDTFWD